MQIVDTNTDVQRRWKIDKVTLEKTLRGMAFAVGSAAVMGGLEYLGTIKTENTMLAMFLAWLVPSMITFVRQWRKGEA